MWHRSLLDQPYKVPSVLKRLLYSPRNDAWGGETDSYGDDLSHSDLHGHCLLHDERFWRWLLQVQITWHCFDANVVIGKRRWNLRCISFALRKKFDNELFVLLLMGLLYQQRDHASFLGHQRRWLFATSKEPKVFMVKWGLQRPSKLSSTRGLRWGWDPSKWRQRTFPDHQHLAHRCSTKATRHRQVRNFRWEQRRWDSPRPPQEARHQSDAGSLTWETSQFYEEYLL